MQNWQDHVISWSIDEYEKLAPFLDKRCEEMSPKEWRIFRAALEMNPQDTLAGIAALTFSLDSFAFYYPAGNDTWLGMQLAKHNYGVMDTFMPYLDFAKIAKEYQKEHGGVFVDDAFVCQCSPGELDRTRMKAESIRDYGAPEDVNWSAKLHILGPNGKDAWLRLPDYEEVNGGQADEVSPALADLGAVSLDACELLEARCMLPCIDLVAQYDSLSKLVFDASNLWFAVEENRQGIPHFDEKLKAALEYEQCDNLNFAIDIITNLHCYDYIPNADLKSTSENILPPHHLKQDTILDAFDHEAYAADYYQSRGMWKVDGGFFMRNDKAFVRDYSAAPEKQTAELVHSDPEYATDSKDLLLKLYYPATVNLYERNEYGDMDAYPTEVAPRDAAGYLAEIRARLYAEQFEWEAERGLMQYYNPDDEVNRKVLSAKPYAEVVDGKLYGVAVCCLQEPLTPDELECFKSWWSGQMSDGFGEHLEQQAIRCHDGNEIYVSFWSPDVNWHIHTWEEMRPVAQTDEPELGQQMA